MTSIPRFFTSALLNRTEFTTKFMAMKTYRGTHAYELTRQKKNKKENDSQPGSGLPPSPASPARQAGNTQSNVVPFSAVHVRGWHVVARKAHSATRPSADKTRRVTPIPLGRQQCRRQTVRTAGNAKRASERTCPSPSTLPINQPPTKEAFPLKMPTHSRDTEGGRQAVYGNLAGDEDAKHASSPSPQRD